MEKKDLSILYERVKLYAANIGIKVIASENKKYYYSPKERLISIPLDDLSDLHKLSISFHESGHASDAILKRNIKNYDFEELIAESVAFYLLLQLNEANFISKLKNVSYLSIYMKNLVNKTKKKNPNTKYSVKDILDKVLQFVNPAMFLILERGGFKNE